MVRKGRSFSGNERNCVYVNLGSERFADVSGISGMDFADDARAVGQVDWDNDGDLDFWISNRNSPQVRFLQNNAAEHDGVISVHLRGTDSNRDAVGSRVTLVGANGTRTKTLRAGGGYLAQSSKSMHFANAAGVMKIHVRWPNGNEEEFPLNGSTGHRIVLLVEGASVASTQPLPSIPSLSEPIQQKISRTKSALCTSVVGLPIPSLPYTSTDYGDTRTEKDVLDIRGPILLNLWGSWCAPCLSELERWNDGHQELKSSGIKVLALNVDHLDGEASKNEGATVFTENLTFELGSATRVLVERLQTAHDFLFSLQSPLPLPCSFLLDEQHQIVAVYKGPVEIDRIRNDLKLRNAAPDQKRDASTLFRGRWAGKTRTLPLGPFVLDLIHGGQIDAASEFVQRNQNRFRKATLLDLVVRLGMAHRQSGNHVVADRHFETARKIEPKTVGPEIEQGKMHERQGRHEIAKQFYMDALKRNNNSPQALNNLAWLLATSNDANVHNSEQALKFAMRASTRTGNRHPGILDTVAVCLAEQQRWAEAIDVATKAQTLAREARLFRLANEIEKRALLFADKKPYRTP